MDLLKSAGFFLECTASRGILLSNVLGKTYRKIIRNRTMPFLESSSLDTMCGGLLHRGCDFASHILNATLDLCRMRKASLLCLFVDVVAALKGYNTNVTIYDPWANEQEVMQEYQLQSKKEIPIRKYDAIILTVAHNEFKELDFRFLRKEKSILYDVKNILDNSLVDGKL